MPAKTRDHQSDRPQLSVWRPPVWHKKMVWAELEGGQRWHDTDLSATVSAAFLHKGIFLASYKDSLRAKCGGERFESGERLLHVSREDTTMLLCMFPLCGRPVVSQIDTGSISSVLELLVDTLFLIFTRLRIELDVNHSSLIQIWRKLKIIFSLDAGLWPLLSHRRGQHIPIWWSAKNKKLSLCCLLKNEPIQLT